MGMVLFQTLTANSQGVRYKDDTYTPPDRVYPIPERGYPLYGEQPSKGYGRYRPSDTYSPYDINSPSPHNVAPDQPSYQLAPTNVLFNHDWPSD